MFLTRIILLFAPLIDYYFNIWTGFNSVFIYGILVILTSIIATFAVKIPSSFSVIVINIFLNEKIIN
jgi:hypothetical protein